jgi:hypothetical protein
LKALAALEANDSNRLALVRTRAEKWLGGLTAVTGLLGTVVIIKGPQSASSLPTSWRVGVGVLVLMALVALVYAVCRAYQSAYGDPAHIDELPVQPITGLAARLRQARATSAQTALHHLGSAFVATLVAVSLLTVAVAITWFTPSGTPTQESVCLSVDGTTVAKFPGDTITMKSIADGVSITSCK